MICCVTVLDRSGKPRSELYEQDEIKIGRSSQNDVRLDPYVDIEVSRRHGLLRCKGEEHFTYEDVGSTQGSFMNGRRIEGEVTLSRGDQIVLGRNGPAIVVTWPIPRVTGTEGTYLRYTVRESPFFPLVFSEGFSTRFSRYERIGSGGFGEIWRGYLRDSEQTYAIKIMHPELLNPEYLREEDRDSLVRRFRREARLTHALAESGAPSVVKVHNWGDDPDRDFLYIVMDFVVGESLDKTIFKYDVIPQNKAVRYMLGIAEGIAAAHNFEWTEEDGSHCKGIVHRDIKPNNILIEDSSDEAYLVDFGIAGIQTGGERLTATSVRVGSHKFLSIEAMEDNVIDPSADLWAFAVTSFLLLSRGHFPYKGNDSLELIKNMREGKMRPIEQYRSDLHPELTGLLRAALDPHPDNRPKRAEDWIRVLRSITDSATQI
ncbi:MAG: FHA domain-containing serine/threonine-protein kinase [Candidatus Sumerlaeia bacterium]|nr:FHA domain-containing serine/threonine-protein kinase [Candidatus Sumerlaeia bacterium]